MKPNDRVVIFSLLLLIRPEEEPWFLCVSLIILYFLLLNSIVLLATFITVVATFEASKTVLTSLWILCSCFTLGIFSRASCFLSCSFEVGVIVLKNQPRCCVHENGHPHCDPHRDPHSCHPWGRLNFQCLCYRCGVVGGICGGGDNIRGDGVNVWNDVCVELGGGLRYWIGNVPNNLKQ